jgi:hypothetical protein
MQDAQAGFTGQGCLPMVRANLSLEPIGKGKMRTEIENIVDEIKQSIGLLRRHL